MKPDDPWQRFEHGTDADLEAFLAGVEFNRPVSIMLAGETWGPRACEIIAATRPGIDLRAVFMRGAPIRDRGIELLLVSPVLATARLLGIERCGLTDIGVERLAHAPQLMNLRDLLLCNRGGIETGPLNAIGDQGAMALAASPHLSHVRELDLWNTDIGDLGFEAIVTSPNLQQLATLYTWGTRLTHGGADRIKGLASEQEARRSALIPGATYCWIHTDYDERIITYSE